MMHDGGWFGMSGGTWIIGAVIGVLVVVLLVVLIGKVSSKKP